ncbi:MAG TPA: hypothetical protein VG722_13900 [Tepidisphaeraceae bacterium]|nr:hypothetical protein [Tepidisphaeraceae bacterium]
MILQKPAVSRFSAVRFLARNNPFYVLSAMCMLAGLFILNDSLHYSPIPPVKLLTLIATLNVYEWFIIGLSVLLLRRGILRDGALILLIEVFFLADVAFLNSELFTASPSLAWPISLVLLGLDCVKLLVILGALDSHRKEPLTHGTVQLVLFCSLSLLVLLFAIPGFLFKYADLHGGQVPASILYRIWWIVGMLPALAVFLPGSQRLFAAGSRLGTMRFYIFIPFFSLIAHVAVSHWVYKTPFYSEDLAPLLLGMAVFVARCDRHEFTARLRIRLHVIFPAVAILLSISHDPFFSFHLAGGLWTPMRLACVAAALVYIDGIIVFRRMSIAIPAVVCAILAWLGSSPETIANNASHSANHAGGLLSKILPSTATQWGILALTTSFFLLAIGAAISFAMGNPPPVPADPSPPESEEPIH